MAHVKTASKTAEPSRASATQPKTFFNSVVATRYNSNIAKCPFCFEKDSPFIDVRGTSVPFDKYHINVQFGLVGIQDEHTTFVESITAEGLTQVLEDLCIEGTRWTISNQECYIVERALLKPIGKIWYHFLRSRLIPSTYNTNVSKERILLLHSIIKGKRINVGRIIFQEVHWCAEKNASSLKFPSLITYLCRTAQVPLNDNEDITTNKVYIRYK
ncbi:hypothetical protein V6Z11_D01G152500 [Gossypium hirsutum]